MRNGLRKICAVAAAMLLSTGAFSSTAFADWGTQNGKTYYDDFLSSSHQLPIYETAFVPVKLSEPSDFSNDFVNCININGELYHISLEYMEKYDGWNDIKEDIAVIMGSDDLPVDSYKELRNMFLLESALMKTIEIQILFTEFPMILLFLRIFIASMIKTETCIT